MGFIWIVSHTPDRLHQYIWFYFLEVKDCQFYFCQFIRVHLQEHLNVIRHCPKTPSTVILILDICERFFYSCTSQQLTVSSADRVPWSMQSIRHHKRKGKQFLKSGNSGWPSSVTASFRDTPGASWRWAVCWPGVKSVLQEGIPSTPPDQRGVSQHVCFRTAQEQRPWLGPRPASELTPQANIHNRTTAHCWTHPQIYTRDDGGSLGALLAQHMTVPNNSLQQMPAVQSQTDGRTGVDLDGWSSCLQRQLKTRGCHRSVWR